MSIDWIISIDSFLICIRLINIVGSKKANMIRVEFHKIDEVADNLLKYAVVPTWYNNKWVWVRHQDRQTWEIPAGHREPNEDILKTAERELIEETGATEFQIQPIAVYSVTIDNETTYGILCYALVKEFNGELLFEICERKTFDYLPEQLTYPDIQPHLMDYVENYLVEN